MELLFMRCCPEPINVSFSDRLCSGGLQLASHSGVAGSVPVVLCEVRSTRTGTEPGSSPSYLGVSNSRSSISPYSSFATLSMQHIII
jgi:hypothetical protein